MQQSGPMSPHSALVIGGSARGVGRTTLGCAVTRELVGSGLRVAAVKATPIRDHDGPEIEEGPGREGSDTWRYSLAGASTVVLLRAAGTMDLRRLAGDLELSPAQIVIWESSRASVLMPSAVFAYILDPLTRARPPGPDGPYERIADLVLPPLAGSRGEQLGLAVRLTTDLLLQGAESSFRITTRHWVSRNGRRLIGEGRAGLLRAIEETGSLSRAAGLLGISYKRAWSLISDAERDTGALLTLSRRGGRGGGGTSLTALGKRLLAIYDEGGRATGNGSTP